MLRRLARPGPTPVERAEALLALHDVLAEAADDLPRVLSTATEAVARLCGDTAVLFQVGDDGATGRVMHLASSWHDDPAARSDLQQLGAPVRLPEAGPSFLWAVATGDPVLLPSLSAADLEVMHPNVREYFARWGLASMVLVPLHPRGSLLGVLGVSRDGTGPAYDEDDLAFVTRVGTQVALALDNATLVDAFRRELAERTAAEERMRQLAVRDVLTGLPNRTWLTAELVEAVTAGPVSLALLDLDGFKDVNDGLGHGLGDEVLAVVGERLQRALTPGLSLARLGGDEFAVLVRGPDGAARAADAAQRMHEALVPPLHASGTRLQLSASVGIASTDGSGQPGSEGAATALLRQADVAMYRAKRSGGGTASYEAERDGDALHQLQRVAELRTALAENQLVVHYQPVVDVSTGSVHHHEALVRWQHPVRGLVPPGEFVPLAERAGLGLELTDAVVDAVLDSVVRRRAEGRSARTAVNVSASVLAEPGWPAAFLARVSRAGALATDVVVEVTEAAAASTPAQQALHELASAGVDVSLDDFGTGWSSLAQLKTLPLQEVKIDRAFVADVATNAVDQALVGAVVALADTLGLSVVGEGVETAETAQVLSRLGVSLQQGYLHGRPGPAPVDGDTHGARSLDGRRSV